MKLLTQLFLIKDSKGKNADANGKNIVLALNGEKTDTKVQDMFSELEFDSGEIYGNSLLSYYSVQEDGSLQVEGSKIQFIDADTDEIILIKKIERPYIKSDGNISFEDIKAFSEYFKIAKPDEVFVHLSEEEKQAFITKRQEAETAGQASALATAKAKADSDRIEKEQAEIALKASIDPAYVQDMNAYLSTQSFYAAVDGFKQYTKAPYNLFYGEDPNQSLCILIDRAATWKEEVKEENYEIVEKNDKQVVIQFLDGNVSKYLTLNLEAGEIEITDAKAKE